jgi:hypothetical protein
MKNLIAQLMTETQELKRDFLLKTSEFATSEHERLVAMTGMNKFELGETLGFKSELETVTTFRLGQTPGTQIRVWCLVNGYEKFNYKHMAKIERLQSDIYVANKIGVDAFVSRQVESAREHYVLSIYKLASRIVEKGLNIESLTMSTTYFDPNISTIITDGFKTVKAQTIIASGPIQRPHYRYLVK